MINQDFSLAKFEVCDGMVDKSFAKNVANGNTTYFKMFLNNMKQMKQSKLCRVTSFF